MREDDLGGLGSRSNSAAGGDDGLALRDFKRAGDRGGAVGVLAVERDDGNGAGHRRGRLGTRNQRNRKRCHNRENSSQARTLHRRYIPRKLRII